MSDRSVSSVTSFELRASSFELRASNCELRAASFELRASSCELRAASFELRASSCELRAASFELRASKCESGHPSQPASPSPHVFGTGRTVTVRSGAMRRDLRSFALVLIVGVLAAGGAARTQPGPAWPGLWGPARTGHAAPLAAAP